MKGKKGILLTLLCAGMVAAMVSCSNGDDDSDSSPAPTTETYTGSFTVNGVSCDTLIMSSDGTYTMTGNGVAADNGSYVLSEGTYTFTSSVHNGTFTATKGNDGITITLASGSISASGSGTRSDASGGSNDSGSGGSGVTVDYKTVPLTLEFLADGSITFTNTNRPDSLQYSTDGGATKQNVLGDTLNVSTGDKVCLFANGTGSTATYPFKISCSADCYVYGNVMSLRSPSDYASDTTVVQYQFANLFNTGSNASHIKSHAEKKLVLPATTLAANCYKSMFHGCTSLTAAPALPATTLANHCYESMFRGCMSLTAAPALPATTLADFCYNSMFYGCTGLTAAPALPATALAVSCYNGMFYGCTGLTTAPALPATTLAEGCYSYMFNGCTRLNYIKCLAANIDSNDHTQSWVYRVPGGGTFVKADNAQGWNNGDSGIPNGWTQQTASN